MQFQSICPSSREENAECNCGLAIAPFALLSAIQVTRIEQRIVDCQRCRITQGSVIQSNERKEYDDNIQSNRLERSHVSQLPAWSAAIMHAGVEQLTVQPIKEISGHVKLPGSKSLSNRILLLAALAEGTTLVKNLLVGGSAIGGDTCCRPVG